MNQGSFVRVVADVADVAEPWSLIVGIVVQALARLGEWRAILDHAVRAHASPSKRNRQYTVL